jgi:TRAP-type mannitol/chloroaromatic compound transport system permease large subunit
VNNGTIGWFNSSPPNLQGRVGVAPNTATQVKLAQFVLSQGSSLMPFSLRTAYNNGTGGGVVFADGTFYLPTPGAIALLGLAGLAGRRRR